MCITTHLKLETVYVAKHFFAVVEPGSLDTRLIWTRIYN